MTLDKYQKNINIQKELEIRYENLIEVLKFYVLFTNITKLSFFKYNYELNNYDYDFTVTGKDKFIKIHNIDDKKYSIIIEENQTIYGMISFDEDPKNSDITDELFEKIKIVLQKKFELEKEFLYEDSALEIYIITDKKTIQFANKLQKNLDILLNVNISINTSITAIEEQLKEKTKKSILIYTVDDDLLLKKDEQILNVLNEFLFVIGPSDYDLSLFCGHLNVFKYLSKENLIVEQIKNLIIETKNKIQNKYINKNKIIAVSGIAGGIGTTTVAMNITDLLARNNPAKNILYIDLSSTKAISNLFLEQNPMPEKTIIDLVNSGQFDIEKNLKNGLVKIRENFYAINGIQKHIDSDFLEQDIFIEKLLEYISKISEEFNFIIIDTGEANATALNTTIYDIVNELWILTEMSLPHISKLKTFFSLMKRAGLKDKISFLVNRYDSVNAISVSDVTSILNTANEDHLNFEFKIPNDYNTLGHCWNYCELVTQTFPKSPFVLKLKEILTNKGFFQNQEKKEINNTSWLSFLKKGKK